MENPFYTYKLIECSDNCFFIGANSEHGFVLAPDGVFDEENFDKVYILKGGPGTGKSTFMKKAVKEAKSSGAVVSIYCCSSDPESVDAVIIEYQNIKILIIDGTHPHITEMKYPGAVSEIINLSVMWNGDILTENIELIKELTNKKSECFNTAYKYLRAAAEIDRSLEGITHRVCDSEKLLGAVRRFISPFLKYKGDTTRVYTEAFSMNGMVTTGHFLKRAEKIYFLSDCLGISALYLKALSEELESKGIAHVKTVCPSNSELLTGIYIPSADVYVTNINFSTDKPTKTVNMKRFLNSETKAFKGRYRFGVKCRNALYEGASNALSEAKKYHFELEKLYSDAMNFKAVNKIYRDKISVMFKENDNYNR